MTRLDSIDWKTQIKRLEGAYAPSTLKGYYTDLSIFVGWCRARGIDWINIGAEELVAFIDAEAARQLTFATIQRRLYAIRRLLWLSQLPDPTLDPEVTLALRRIKRARPMRPAQALGLTEQLLTRLLAAQPDTPWGLRDAAVLALGYDILSRRSELTALKTGDVTWRPDGTLEVVVRRSKSDPFGLGRIAFTSRRAASLVSQWLEWRGPEITPLFCGIYRGRAIDRPLTGSSIKLIVKNSARRAGYDESVVAELSAHSLRIGAAQDLLKRGQDGAAIMRAGGWKSTPVMARYLAAAQHNVWD